MLKTAVRPVSKAENGGKNGPKRANTGHERANTGPGWASGPGPTRRAHWTRGTRPWGPQVKSSMFGQSLVKNDSLSKNERKRSKNAVDLHITWIS